MFANPKTLKELPNLIVLRTEMELPRLTLSTTLRAEPHLQVDLIDSDEPSCTNCTIEAE
jgi:hypothetical protein